MESNNDFLGLNDIKNHFILQYFCNILNFLQYSDFLFKNKVKIYKWNANTAIKF